MKPMTKLVVKSQLGSISDGDSMTRKRASPSMSMRQVVP